MDIFESDEELLMKYYDKDNYYVEDIEPTNKVCLCCFSSHATYYPFTREAFISKIVEEDRYEFKNITKSDSIRKRFGRIIYMRDLYREWYVNGINSRIDSIDKIILKLQELTQGYEIFMLGTSSGGYLATIAGIKLNAKVIYNFSGQYSLKQWENRKWLSMYAGVEEKCKYYDIVEMIKETSIPIVYCYPAKAKDDIKQVELVKGCNNVISFAFNYKNHGQTVFSCNYKYIFEYSIKSLRELSLKFQGKMFKATTFLIMTGGLRGLGDLIKSSGNFLFGRKIKRKRGNGKVL